MSTIMGQGHVCVSFSDVLTPLHMTAGVEKRRASAVMFSGVDGLSGEYKRCSGL